MLHPRAIDFNATMAITTASPFEKALYVETVETVLCPMIIVGLMKRWAMKVKVFEHWLSGLSKLSRGQREIVNQRLNNTAARDAVVKQLEQDTEKACPGCGGSRLYRWGRSAGMQRFRCRDCGKTFNVLSGTTLAHLRYKERWLTYSQAMIEGASVRETAQRCDIDKTTSFRWRHRFLRIPASQKAPQLHGIAEADETFFRDSCKEIGRASCRERV